MHSDVIFVLVVGTALAFDFTNGFHDTANVVATSISTRALPPRVAIGLASLLNFAGAFISLKVAATVGKGIVDAGSVTDHPTIVFAGLVAPDQVLHIGSRVAQDIIPARKLGMKTGLFAGYRTSLQATPEQMKEPASRLFAPPPSMLVRQDLCIRRRSHGPKL